MDDLDEMFSNAGETSQEVEPETETSAPAQETVETTTEENHSDEVAASETETTAEPTKVPLAVAQAERAKVRELADKVARLEAELNQRSKSVVTTPAVATPAIQNGAIPDPYDDPQAYTAHVMKVAQQQALEAMQMQNLTHSRNRAAQKYGEEMIQEVGSWAQQHAVNNPAFEAQLMSQPDPAEWVIAEKKRFDTLKDFETDPDAYAIRRAAELGYVAPAQADVHDTTSTKKDTGPSSLVNAKSRTDKSPKKSMEEEFLSSFD